MGKVGKPANQERGNQKTIGVIAAVVVGCYAVVAGLVGFLGRSSYTPRAIDKLFGLTEYLEVQLATRRVDSGYSKVFIFSGSTASDDTQLMFYAVPSQPVKLTICASATGPPLTVKVLLDGELWTSFKTPYNIVQGDVTKKLRFDVPPGENVHTLKFIPPGIVAKQSASDVAVVECLVMVYKSAEK